MKKYLENKLINIARVRMSKNDSSHDINHMLRVVDISKKIAIGENADLEIVVPSAIFHDVINYPKNHQKRFKSANESAEFAKTVLEKINFFSNEQIKKIYESIDICSFTKAKIPNFLEAKVLQDADGLESIGAVSIMRTFSSAGSMGKYFYNPIDTFCLNRKPDDSKYALDLFFTRLLIVQGRLHTKTAKKMAKKRVSFLRYFLKQLRYELLDNINYER